MRRLPRSGVVAVQRGNGRIYKPPPQRVNSVRGKASPGYHVGSQKWHLTAVASSLCMRLKPSDMQSNGTCLFSAFFRVVCAHQQRQQEQHNRRRHVAKRQEHTSLLKVHKRGFFGACCEGNQCKSMAAAGAVAAAARLILDSMMARKIHN